MSKSLRGLALKKMPLEGVGASKNYFSSLEIWYYTVFEISKRV